jgi:S1-C subfamily serine protease
MGGFTFGSGLQKNNQGKPTGNGIELVPQEWCGSGFLVNKDGTVVTNYHVARRGLKGQAIFDGGAKYDLAHLKVYDSANDLAVVKISSSDAFPSVTLGDSDRAEMRDDVLAAGNGLCEGLSVADGKIIQIQREEKRNQVHRIVHTASIAGGNSGGPLYKDAQVVGINVAGARGYQRYYAIPVNNLRPLLAEKYDRVIYLGDVFPTNIKAIVDKSSQLFARSGRIGPASKQGSGVWRIRAELTPLRDYVVVVTTPSKRDLDIAIADQSGNLMGLGTTEEPGVEVVLLANDYDQVVTINVLNPTPAPLDFGVSLYEIRW